TARASPSRDRGRQATTADRAAYRGRARIDAGDTRVDAVRSPDGAKVNSDRLGPTADRNLRCNCVRARVDPVDTIRAFVGDPDNTRTVGHSGQPTRETNRRRELLCLRVESPERLIAERRGDPDRVSAECDSYRGR